MKKIGFTALFIFIILTLLAIVGSFFLCHLILKEGFGLGLEFDFLYFILFTTFYFLISILELRLWLWKYPVPTNRLIVDEELWYVHVYQLFYVITFTFLMKNPLLPLFIIRGIYLCLGARMEENSYTGGIIYDPHLVKIGSNTLLGEKTTLTPHQMEGSKLAYYPIIIGSNVTVGVNAVLLPGVIIEDHGLVASGSIVTKGTHIKKGEIWGGVPAKILKKPEA